MATANGGLFSTTVEADEERKETDKLRKELFENFTMFLLNNILMSVQFFENYERDILHYRETSLEEKSLERDHFKVFDGDTLHKLISRKVMYQKRSATKENPELLHPLRMYVTYQNVELSNNASSLESRRVNYNPYYRLIVQRCEDDWKEASGYVNVIESAFADEQADMVVGGGTLIHHPDRPGSDDDAEDTKKKYIPSGVLLSKNDTFYVLEPRKRMKPYPLRDYRTCEKITQPAAIPKSCFKEHEQQFIGNVRRRIGVVLNKTRKGKITHKMLISAAFKRHFSQVFASTLAGQLQLDKARLETATFHLDHVVVKKQHAIYHVTPLLEMKEWPYAITIDLYNEGITKSVKWPTKTMQRTIQKLGCSLVPMGYHETTEENTDYTLEWKIDFPKAEKYLIMHMMHTHIRCYLFALLLYKTFIGTEESAVHFGPSHIVNLMFLMVRRNFLAWPEYSQGETLMRYLRILEKTLQKKCLKSFFLRNCNLYRNCPQRVLHKVQTILMRIIQNPIAYILKALMNLKYKDDFYPQLDFIKLYNILTVKNLGEYLQPLPPKYMKGRKKTVQSHPEPHRLGCDTIDQDEIIQEKNTPLHREEVLRLFIEHFINIANHSRKCEAYDYSMLYLIHARRLTMILSEESGTRGEIQDFNEKIHNGILHCTKPRRKEMGNIQAMKDITNKKGGSALWKPTLSFKPIITQKIPESEVGQEIGTRL